jgi:hypothetical protein
MPYFIIYNSDGDTNVRQVDKETLIKRIQPEGDEGNCSYGKVGFLDKIDNSNTDYWGDNVLIIKGEIVTPRPKKVILTFDID